MIKLKHYSVFVLLGGLSCWLADIAIKFTLEGKLFWIALVFFVPLSVVIAYFSVKQKVEQKYAVSLPLFMIVGIWVFGPLGIAIGAIPTGGTFLTAGNIKGFLTLWAGFPISTWLMAPYSGSVGAIFLSPVILLILTLINARKQRTKS